MPAGISCRNTAVTMSPTRTSSPPAVWDRVICGIDGTAAGLDAARQVARLMPASAQLTLCAVVNPASIDPSISSEQRLTREADEALGQTQQEIAACHDADVILREGPPIRMLLDELIAERATLVTVGSHDHRRGAGIALGSVATAMLHEAPCSVLVAHGTARRDARSGREIIVGFDGSASARRALAIGWELSKRLAVKLCVIVATGGVPTGPIELPWLADDLERDVAVTEDPRSPVDALADASVSADLLIMGSRHLPGVLAALLSVSERAARQAHCPVLVVR